MDSPFERVYTVHDWYDRPRAGFADFGGVPHAYAARWRDDLDDWEEEYVLTPITPQQLELVLEDWAIWQRWETAFRSGHTTLATHPAMPEDAERHAVLAPQLAAILSSESPGSHRAVGEFRARGGGQIDPQAPSGQRQLEVRWSPFGDSPAS